jgi:hypothetical protein
MSAHIQFDDTVTRLAAGATGAEVAPGTVHAALLQVARRFPSLHAFNCDGDLRSVLKVTRDGQPVSVRETLADGDTIRLGVG